jgi:aspartyl/asparaginyl beta-hydroxylase (cupin superfamily)
MPPPARRRRARAAPLLRALAMLALLSAAAAQQPGTLTGEDDALMPCAAQLPSLRTSPMPTALAALRACTMALLGPNSSVIPDAVPYALMRVINAVIGEHATPPFLPKRELFPESALLEESWRVIASEAAAVLETRAVPDFGHVDPNQADTYGRVPGAWRMYVLRLMGSDVEAHLAACPHTAALLARCRGVRNAFFSVLAPGATLTTHAGLMRSVARYQLGLIIPQPTACTLTLTGRDGTLRAHPETPTPAPYHWREGEGVLWDDTWEHFVAHNGTPGGPPRVVLFLDVRRPDVSRRARVLDEAAAAGMRRMPAFEGALRRAEAAPLLEGEAAEAEGVAAERGGEGSAFELRR